VTLLYWQQQAQLRLAARPIIKSVTRRVIALPLQDLPESTDTPHTAHCARPETVLTTLSP